MDIDIIIPILYAVVIINTIMASMMFARGIKNIFNLLFGMMALAVSAWSFAIIGFYTESLKNQFNWIALTHSFALFSALALLYFAIFFPKKIIKNKFLIILPVLPFLAILYFLFFTNSILGAIEGPTYVINYGYKYYESVLITYFVSSYVALITQYLKAEKANIKEQIRLIFAGSLVTSAFGMYTNLILPAKDVFSYTWLGPIFTFILAAAIFVAILRYNLFNIKVIITEFVSILLIVGLSVDIFAEINQTLIYLKVIVLFLVIIFVYFLIKSVDQEIKLREDLETANIQQESLIHFITHQIKGFFSKSRGIYSMVLEGDYGPIPEKMIPIIKEGLESETKGVAVVKEILDSANLKKGTIQYKMTNFDFSPVVTSSIEEAKKMATERHLEILAQVPEGKFECVGDPDELKHVVKNLIDNAIRYTPAGKIKVSLSQNESKLRLSVSDTGVGIAPEDMQHIFTAGGKGKDSVKINVESTGFGLFIAKKITEDHKGSIWVESEGLGKGSTFYVELPKSRLQ